MNYTNLISISALTEKKNVKLKISRECSDWSSSMLTGIIVVYVERST